MMKNGVKSFSISIFGIYFAGEYFFLAQSDWFLYLEISCTIHLRAKQIASSFVYVAEEELFFN